MKSSFFGLVFLSLCGHFLFAQSPGAFKYQAVVRDNSGVALSNKAVGLRLSILKNTAAGTSVYSETFHPTTNEFGLVNLEVGRGNVIGGNFSSIDWSVGDYFIGVEIDINGGSNFQLMGTSQLLSVPYALYAKTAGNGFSGDYNDLKNKPAGGSSSGFNGDYNSLTNKPTIPTTLSNLTLNAGGSNITNVGSPVVATDAATKAYVDELRTYVDALKKQLSVFVPDAGVEDIEGNIYSAVKIGTQIWMQENLKTTKYNDGASIDNITDYTTWKTYSSGAYSWYNNDEGTYKNRYGALYNWYAVNTNKLCPTDWHVPTDAEWATLVNFLGGWEVAGGKMKQTGTTSWAVNEGATNSSGFNGLPGGTRNNVQALENFINVNYIGYWWSITPENATRARGFALLNFTDDASPNGVSDKVVGHSVRCLKN
jgi:uncharacterized protein (TIGR02145 family)